MKQTILALCDRGRGAHVLARLVYDDGEAKISVSIGTPSPTKSLSTPRTLSNQSETWGTMSLASIESSDVDDGVSAFCGNCRRAYRLRFRAIVAAYRNGEPPVILARIEM